MKIHLLAPDVVERIAAGEVLERPANLVKELVENSLDAQADQIDVAIEDGGRTVIVSDNGHGMGPEDLNLALRRHATSKITNSEDLFHLNSFGFRGEALASIAAVSRLTLTSRLRASDQGFRVCSQFGEVADLTPISARQGSEVCVSELFNNVPARLKFLKSDAAENAQIRTTLKALALAHEGVGFSLKINGEFLFHWPKGQDFASRGKLVLEREVLFAGDFATDGFRAQVLISSPQDTVNVNRNLWFFVQGRWIQDRSLAAAVLDAYRNLLMHGEYPTAIVRLTVPTQEVDVNVHPTKSQVKFRDSQQVFRVTHRAVRQVLEQSPWLESTPAGAPPLVSLAQPEVPVTSASFKFQAPEFQRTQYATKSFPVEQVRDIVRNYMPGDAQTAFQWRDLQVLAQLNQTYILAQSQDSFYMVDQHAAHERVVFERLMASFHQGGIEVQNLLLPLVLDFSVIEVDALLARQAAVEKLGLSLERMGPESVAVQAIPMIVNETGVSEALRRLAFDLCEGRGELAWEKSIAEIFASMACHSVIRAGQSLSREEMASLLHEMDQYPLSSFCPHGRPVFVKRRWADIEREFGRIV